MPMMKTVLKWFAYGATAFLSLLLIITAFLGFTRPGASFLAEQISSLVSSEDQRITISPLNGLLNGNLRVEEITLADRNGDYGKLSNVAIDWSPSALLTGTFHAQSVSAGQITVTRAPAPARQPVAEESTGGFSLPVNVQIDDIQLADIHLGKNLVGRDFDLTLNGNATATSDLIDLSLNAARQDVPQAGITADLDYQPNNDILAIKAALSEPQGGLVAKLIGLAGEPAVDISVDGAGPLSDWKGKLAASVSKQPVFNLEGSHQLSVTGERRLTLSGGGQPEQLLPELYRQLFNGQTAIDLAAVLDGKGKVEIQAGSIDTGALLLNALGTYDPNGGNNITINLIGTNGPVDFRMPMGDGILQALINGADVSLQGAADKARLNAAVSLQSLALPQGKFDDIRLTAASDDLNLQQQTGVVTTNLSVTQSAMISAELDRAVKAPMKLMLPIRLSADKIAFEGATLESASIGGTGSGTYEIANSAFASNLRLFILPSVLPQQLAQQLSGTIGIEAYVAQDGAGKTSVENLIVKSELLEANGSLELKGDQVSAQLGGRVLDLQKLTPQAEGRVGFSLEANGPLTAPNFKLDVNSASATLAGKALTALHFTASGKADAAAPQADVTASGSIDGQVINAKAQLLQGASGTEIPGLLVEVGQNILTGDLKLSQTFMPSGNLNFDFPDLSLLAALAAQDASGSAKGDIEIANDNGVISATVKADVPNLVASGASIDTLTADIAVSDLSKLIINGDVTAKRIASGTNVLDSIKLTINNENAKTAFDLKSNYDRAPLAVRGAIDMAGNPLSIQLDEFSAAPKGISVRLDQPTRIAVVDGAAALKDLTIRTGDGRVTINGKAGAQLDLNIGINSLPASLINSFVPSLDAAGGISGKVGVQGAASNPNVNFDLNWNDAAVSQTRSAGLGALGINAKGNLSNGILDLNTTATGAGGLNATANGKIGVIGNNSLGLTVKGNIPFAALAGITAAQGLVLDGSANADIQITGTTSAPNIQGSVTTDNARLTDIRRNLTVNNVGATVTFTGQSASITRLTGKLAGGGDINGTGSIGFGTPAGMPVDLTVTLNRAVYNDGTLVTTAVSGPITLSGNLASTSTLKGDLTLDKTAITIPEKLPSSLAEINIQRRNAPAAVLRQDEILNRDRGGSGTQSTMNLDLRIRSGSSIFVRGRGIDAELSGDLTVRGTAAAPVVSGGFQMRRGRLEILTRRLEFTRGNITFGGGLVPVLDMSADSNVGSSTVTVAVTGNANDPTFGFSSTPAAPQDEVLAQLIFGQSMSQLSPIQIARLADAAAQLAGGRSTSLFDSLRSNLGVDDLDISTDEKGDAKVSAGKYINDRTYLQLEQSGSDGPKATINLDIGRGVKLRGSAGGDGEGAAGIFYEKEY
jgi:translocation and assembly module TamB